MILDIIFKPTTLIFIPIYILFLIKKLIKKERINYKIFFKFIVFNLFMNFLLYLKPNLLNFIHSLMLFLVVVFLFVDLKLLFKKYYLYSFTLFLSYIFYVIYLSYKFENEISGWVNFGNSVVLLISFLIYLIIFTIYFFVKVIKYLNKTYNNKNI